MLYDTDNGEDDNDNGEYGKNNGEYDNGDGKDDDDDGVGYLDDDAPPVLEPFFLGGCGKVAAGRRLDANSFHFIHNLT